MLNCKTCKSYKGCPGKEFYFYSEIRFCPHQILFIIEHSATLLSGKWPPNPEGSSYIDTKIKTGFKSEAYFVKPVGILAEVNDRLKRTGTDGKLLRAEVLAGLELSQESKDALMYIKGWRRKTISYRRWKAQRKYRRILSIKK